MGTPTYAADTTTSNSTPVTSTPSSSGGMQSVPAGGYAAQSRALSPAANSYSSGAAALSLRGLAGGQELASTEAEVDESPESLEAVYSCFDDNAVIRTPPDYASAGSTIPYGTRITLVSIDGRNAEVRLPGGTVVWTRRSNIRPIRQEISSARIDTEKLETVSAAVVAMVPESLRSYAETAVREILTSSARMGVTDAYQVAYLLATAQHESRFGKPNYSRSESLVEDANPGSADAEGNWSARNHVSGGTSTGDSADALETDYWDDAYGHKLGNTEGTSDGADFRGRGFVQLTGRANYKKMTAVLNGQNFSYEHEGVRHGGTPPGGIPACTATYAGPIDLITNFEHVNLVPALAARVLVVGSQEGYFTGRSLDDKIGPDTHSHADLTSARSIINGDTAENGAKIADRAVTYAATLNAGSAWAGVFQATDET